MLGRSSWWWRRILEAFTVLKSLKSVRNTLIILTNDRKKTAEEKKVQLKKDGHHPGLIIKFRR
jgi:ribonucleotide monophosphatase NagD (HAD superfamily)